MGKIILLRLFCLYSLKGDMHLNWCTVKKNTLEIIGTNTLWTKYLRKLWSITHKGSTSFPTCFWVNSAAKCLSIVLRCECPTFSPLFWSITRGLVVPSFRHPVINHSIYVVSLCSSSASDPFYHIWDAASFLWFLTSDTVSYRDTVHGSLVRFICS